MLEETANFDAPLPPSRPSSYADRSPFSRDPTHKKAAPSAMSTESLHAKPSRDAGGASIQLVLAVPTLMLCLLFVVQAAVWWHATHVAQSAATRAVDTARVDGGTAAAGEATGRDTVTALGDTVLRDPSVDVERTATETRAEVRGVAMTVIPGVRWRVRATAVAPTERFTLPGALPRAVGR